MHCVHQKSTVTGLQHQHQNIGNRMECSIEKVMLIIVKCFGQMLYNKYSKEYNRFVVSGYIKQGYNEWKEIAIELGKLYKQ
jgi:hypothetical protein